MLEGIRCRWRSGDNTEEVYSIEECLSCAASGCNPCGYPYAMLALMARERKPEVVQCSATMFGGCPREQGIKKHVPYTLNPEQVYTRAFGSAVHFALEQQSAPASPSLAVEERFARKIVLDDGREMYVTAALDALYASQRTDEFRIKDYKVVESITDSALSRKLAWYIPQFSIQRWILEGLGKSVVDIELVFLAHKGKRNVNLYPDGEPEFPDARIWSLEKTEDYLRMRGPALLSSLEAVETLRLALPHTLFLVHQTKQYPWADGQNIALAELHARIAVHALTTDVLTEVFAERSNVSSKEWEQMLSADEHFFDVRVAEQLGLIDGVLLE